MGPQNNEEKTKEKGHQNDKGKKKKRPVYKVDKVKLCLPFIDVKVGEEPNCGYTNCKFSHDVKAYLESKPPDIGTECFIYSSLGHCSRGITCRFSNSHLDKDLKNLRKDDIYTGEPQERNHVDRKTVTELRKKVYNFKRADDACNESFDILRKREEKEKSK